MALKFKSNINGKAIDAVTRKLKALGAPLKQGDFKKIGKNAVRVMNKLISKGISPLRGGGFSKRFPKYKRQDDPRGYPANVKSKYRTKRQKPVNLKLTGKFLKALDFRANSKGVLIGYFDKKQAIKEDGHRKGTNKQPKRPTIPKLSSNERFVASIQDEYLKVANAKVKQITKK